MKITHFREPLDGLAIENTFSAYDSNGSIIGRASVHPMMLPQFLPARPHQILLRVEAEPEALDALYGAAITRARVLAMQKGCPARIYTDIKPNDPVQMEHLSLFGFQDDDGLVSMAADLLPGVVYDDTDFKGFAVAEDLLDDQYERPMFLKRYNALYSDDKDLNWLTWIASQPDFRRFMLVDEKGMVGEVLTWTVNGCGVIGFIYTAEDKRRRGVALYMLDTVRRYLTSIGVYRAAFEVRVKAPGLVKLAEKAGYRQVKRLRAYPGIDIN